MHRTSTSIIFILLGCSTVSTQRLDCRTEDVNSCIRLAEPLLEPSNVFPTQTKEVDHVCNVLFPQTWSKFVDCIKQYTTSCLSQDQRSDFNRAVGDSINSVHKMCTNDDYKNDYLRHASCIKDRSVEAEYCGTYYNTLLDMVRGTTPANQREICCTHSSFKECVIAETESCPCTGDNCSRGMEATGFARAMLDKALGFLLKQCQSYVPEERDCKIYQRKQVKQPRVEENTGTPAQETRYDSGAYFPSGTPNREERRQDEDWTSINGKEARPDNQVEERTTNPPPPLVDPGTGREETTIRQFIDPFVQQQPQENERRKPWIPTADIHSFDDIFNSVDNTRAQELASGSQPLAALLALLTSLLLVFVI